MASEPQGTAPVGDAGSTAGLKRVKEVEIDLDARLAQTKAETSREIERMHAEAEAVIHSAQVGAEKEREQRVSESRAAVEVEAKRIEADGDTEARRLEADRSVDVSGLKAKLLGAIFEGFLDPSKE